MDNQKEPRAITQQSAPEAPLIRPLDDPKMAAYLRNEIWISAYIEMLECELRKAQRTSTVAAPEEPASEQVLDDDEIGRIIEYAADSNGFDTETAGGVDALIRAVVAEVIERVSPSATTASAPAQDRCEHGVWAADHCYQCAADATTASASADTAEFRRLSYAYAEALFKGTAPETVAAWAALVEHVDSLTPVPSPAAPPALTEEITAQPTRDLRHLTDKKLANPEYVRAYIESVWNIVDELSAKLTDQGQQEVDEKFFGLAGVPAQTGTTERAVLQPMPEQGDAVRQWFFDCDGHYIDVAKDEQGRYSIFFKDRSSGKEGWFDQAEPSAGAALTEEAKDAVRYRWLRDKSEPGICAFYLSVGQAFKGVKFARETVDEAIDAAIASHIKAGQAGKDGS